MADQEEVWSRSRMLGDEMAGTLEQRAIDPSRREPEPIEFFAEPPADGADAGKVLCAAVDVDDVLEQSDGARRAVIHRRRNAAFKG